MTKPEISISNVLGAIHKGCLTKIGVFGISLKITIGVRISLGFLVLHPPGKPDVLYGSLYLKGVEILPGISALNKVLK